jgi:hypothetical protein
LTNFELPTTPMISVGTSGSVILMTRLLPSGSSPGKCFFTSASLTTTTLAFSRISRSVKSRPLINGRRIVWK